MAHGITFINPFIEVGGHEWTEYVRSVSLQQMVGMVDSTTFGSDHREFTSTGVYGGTFGGSFNANVGSSGINKLIADLLGTSEAAVELRHQRDPAPVNAANPKFTFNVAVGSFSWSAPFGQLATGQFSFQIVSKITRAES